MMKPVGQRLDQLVQQLLTLLSLSCGLILTLIVVFLLKEAAPVLSFKHLPLFLQSNGWYPLENQFNISPMVLASLLLAIGAMFLALPLGLASAIFLEFYAGPKIRRVNQTLLNLLAGIPSVVFGLWGLTVLVPLITKWQPPGTSLLAGILVLALMILPTIALTSAAALAAVPKAAIAGAAALGLTRKSIVIDVAIPTAKRGILNGGLLAVARALGETMVVLMVAGNVAQTPSSLFDPVRALTANIALEMAYAMNSHRAGLFATGLLLTIVIWLLSIMASRFARGGVQ
jgi:phosphate transport system permease protein